MSNALHTKRPIIAGATRNYMPTNGGSHTCEIVGMVERGIVKIRVQGMELDVDSARVV